MAQAPHPSANLAPGIDAMDGRAIEQSFFLDDAPIDADVAIVLGMNQWWRPARLAVDLYRAGRVGRLLFTGGHNRRIDACEAAEMAAFARREQVPEPAILVEPCAAHTDDNLRFARQLLDAQIKAGALRSVMLVTIHFHLRRTVLAARRHLPAGVKIGWASYPSLHYASSDWHRSERGRADVVSEIGKIATYYDLSFQELMEREP